MTSGSSLNHWIGSPDVTKTEVNDQANLSAKYSIFYALDDQE